MKVAVCKLKSVSPYSQNKAHRTPKLEKELDDAYEVRTWRERCHSNKEGYIFIPPMSFANSLKIASRYLGTKIAGKRNATYTKHFEAGVMVSEPLVLDVKKEEVSFEWVFVPSDGVRGGGKRVNKCFCLIPDWEGTVKYYILDDVITQDVFRKVLEASGLFIGVGRFRPMNWGYYGRFKVVDIQWQEQ